MEAWLLTGSIILTHLFLLGLRFPPVQSIPRVPRRPLG